MEVGHGGGRRIFETGIIIILIIILILIIHTRICQPCLAEWRQVQRGGRVSRRSGNH